MSKALKDIPVVILAGGNGTRVGTGKIIPKPMVEIDDVPLLQYIMDYFSGYGFYKFIIAMGRYSDTISDYFNKYYRSRNPGENDTVTRYLGSGNKNRSHWEIIDVQTGIEDNTGSRISKIADLLIKYPYFILTYGDVVANVNLNELHEFHLSHKKIATVTAVHYPTRFRILGLYGDDNEVRGFADKPVLQKDYISGGFYILNKGVLQMKSLTQDASCSFERHVLEELVQKKELQAFRFGGYWQSLDTERDLEIIRQYIKNIRLYA